MSEMVACVGEYLLPFSFAATCIFTNSIKFPNYELLKMDFHDSLLDELNDGIPSCVIKSTDPIMRKYRSS